jgi:hypothetical protein
MTTLSEHIAPTLEVANDGTRIATEDTLREIDWRFLIPMPDDGRFEHLVLLGGSQAARSLTLDLGIAQEVHDELTGQSIADAIIILNGTRFDPGFVARSLRFGGALYAEIERPRRLSPVTRPGRLRRVMAEVGLDLDEVYWCTPNFAHHEAYVPLTSRDALKWYLSNVHVTRSLRGSIKNTGWRFISRAGDAGMGLLVRRVAITAVKGPAVSSSRPLISIANVPVPRRTDSEHRLVIAPRSRRIVIFPFVDGSPEPLFVAKTSRGPHQVKTEHEQSVLAQIRRRVDSGVSAGLPQGQGMVTWRGSSLGIESVASGRRLLVSHARRRTSNRTRISDLDAVVDWLLQCHLQTQTMSRLWSDPAISGLLDARLAQYEQYVSTSHDVRTFFAEARRRSALASEWTLPWSMCHGDLCLSNVYRTDRGVCLIDWEGGHENIPLLDLTYFITRWHRASQRATDEATILASFASLFVSRNTEDPLVATAHRRIEDYLHTFKINVNLVPLLLLLQWVDIAVRKARKEATLRERLRYVGYINLMAADPARFLTWHSAAGQMASSTPSM